MGPHNVIMRSLKTHTRVAGSTLNSWRCAIEFNDIATPPVGALYSARGARVARLMVMQYVYLCMSETRL